MERRNQILCVTGTPLDAAARQALERYGGEYDVITAERAASDVSGELRRIRRRKYNRIVFLTRDIELQSRMELLKGFLLLAGARHRCIADLKGEVIEVSWLRFLAADIPKLLAEILASMAVALYVFLRCRLALRLAFRIPRRRATVPDEIRRIAYLRTDHWFGAQAGGSVGHTAGVVTGFRTLGYQVEFVSSDNLDALAEEGLPTHVVKPSYRFFSNLPELPEIAYNLRVIARAEALLRAPKPDFIYQRYSRNNYSGIALARRLRVPFVLEYNSSFLWKSKNWGRPLAFGPVTGAVEMANLQAADLVVVVSEALRSDLLRRGIDEKNVLVNLNAVDPEKYNPQVDGSEVRRKHGLEGKTVIGFIGTFGPWHGAEVLATAIRQVVDEAPGCHFLFIGDGAGMPAVRRIIEEARVESQVTFAGTVPQNEAPRYLAACDVLVSPHVPNPDGSPFFGSPTKLFEYMAMGKGIVASNLEQIGEVLEHKRTAILVEPANVPQLAAGIRLLAEDAALRGRLGTEARKDVVAEHTWVKNTERVIAALRERR